MYLCFGFVKRSRSETDEIQNRSFFDEKSEATKVGVPKIMIKHKFA